jgi:hypothetical protein
MDIFDAQSETVNTIQEDIYFEIDELCNRLSFVKNIQEKETLNARLEEYKKYFEFLQNEKIVSKEIAEHIIRIYEDIFKVYLDIRYYIDNKLKSNILYQELYICLIEKIEELHDYLVRVSLDYTKFVICLTILC